MQPSRRKSLPPLPRSIDISAAPESLLLFFVPPTNNRPRVSRRRELRSCLAPRFFLLSPCPQASVSRHSHKAHHQDASLSCSFLWDESSLRNVPRDWCISRSVHDGERRDKEVLDDRETHHWLPSRFMLYPIPCLCGLCSSVWKNKNFQHFCRDAPRNGRSPVSELPRCGLQAFPVAVALLYRVFGPPRLGSDLSFILSTTSLKMNRRPLHPASSNQRFLRFHPTNVFGQVSWKSAFLLPFLVLPASSTIDVLLALLLFFAASLSCSSEIRFLSFSCLFFATHRLTERRLFSVSLSFIFRFGSGFPALAVTPLLLCASFSHRLLCLKSFVTCARLLTTHYFFVFGPFGQQRSCRVRRHLSIHEVVEFRHIFFERLFDSAAHFLSFPSVCPARQLFFCLFLRWTRLTGGDFRRVVVPSRAPHQLQPYSSSYQDSAQVQSRQHFCRGGNVVDAGQGSSCAGESGLSSLECVDHCYPFFPARCP